MAFFPLGRLELKIYPLLTLIVSTLSLHLGKNDKEKKLNLLDVRSSGSKFQGSLMWLKEHRGQDF